MTAYLKSHRWLAAIVLVAAIAFAAGCGASSKDAKFAPARGRRATAARPACSSRRRGADSTLLQTTASSGESAKSGVIGDASGAPSRVERQLDIKRQRHRRRTRCRRRSTARSSRPRHSHSRRTPSRRNFENIGNIAASVGGFIASSSFGNDGDRQTASITIRVPGDKYQDTLIQLRKLGDVKGEQSGANDVTEEYTDLQSRVKNLQAVEAQYVQFLSRAESISDVLTVQDRLNSVRARDRPGAGPHQPAAAPDGPRDHHRAPRPAGDRPTRRRPTASSSPLDVAADSFQASLDVLLGIATVVLAVAAFSWWLLPLAIVGLFIGRRQMRTPRDPRSRLRRPPQSL